MPLLIDGWCDGWLTISVGFFCLDVLFIGVLGIHGSCGCRDITDTSTGTPSSLVECTQGVNFHDCKIISKEDERRDIDDMPGVVPEMRQKFECTGCHEPDEPTQKDVPPWEMVTSFFNRFETLGNDNTDKDRPGEKGKGINKFVQHRISNVRV